MLIVFSDGGDGGSRTRVQKNSYKAFYILSLLWVGLWGSQSNKASTNKSLVLQCVRDAPHCPVPLVDAVSKCVENLGDSYAN